MSTLCQHATITGASRVTGIPRSTIRSAIDRGEIDQFRLGDGTTVIDLEELALWDAKRRKLTHPAISEKLPTD